MLLELKGVKKYFPVKKGLGTAGSAFVRAVDNVDLEIQEGEHLGLVGESGSGKTTLGRIILKLYSVDAGNILFANRDITRLSSGQMRPLRKDLQMVFQDPYSSLDPRYTVRNILKEALDILPKQEKKRESRLNEALDAVGMPLDALDRFPHEFSGGERQRIAIARALIMEPKLVILDEAVSSLDVLIQGQIIKLLQELQKRYAMTYLFITHNLRVVRKLCSRIAVMYQGKIVEMADCTELFRNPLHPYTRELLAAALEYKSFGVKEKIEFKENSQLIDRGGGHFVIN
jgi:ABC-type oligopeptide transport system ATPase subunit